MRIRRMIALALALLALGAAGLAEATMEELRAIRKSAEDAIVSIEAPAPPEETPVPEATPAPTPTPVYPTLEQGAKGDEVKAVQERLKALGHLDGSADGNFGPMTRDAVRAFQESAGLPATGVADQETQAALFAIDVGNIVHYDALKYDSAAADPAALTGTRVEFTGTAMQVLTDDAYADTRGIYTVLRVATRQHAYDVVYVSCFRAAEDAPIAEGDTLRVRGVFMGETQYESASGETVTLPWVEAEEMGE